MPEELQPTRYFRVTDPDGQAHKVFLRYFTVPPAGYWRVRAEADGQDLGTFEAWEIDGNEAIALVGWVQKITGRRDTPYIGGALALFAGAGLVAEEL